MWQVLPPYRVPPFVSQVPTQEAGTWFTPPQQFLDFRTLIRFLCTHSFRAQPKLEIGRLKCTAHSRDWQQLWLTHIFKPGQCTRCETELLLPITWSFILTLVSVHLGVLIYLHPCRWFSSNDGDWVFIFLINQTEWIEILHNGCNRTVGQRAAQVLLRLEVWQR